MRVYRVEREKYLKTTLKGNGAARSEGYRWNSLGTNIVYTSESRALSTLEVSVHLDLSEDLPNDRYYVEIDLPDDVEIFELLESDLQGNWNAKPPSLETQFIGDDFVLNQIAAVLKVPSAIVPQEYNYLINPSHPDSKKIRVITTHSMKFDERLKE